MIIRENRFNSPAEPQPDIGLDTVVRCDCGQLGTLREGYVWDGWDRFVCPPCAKFLGVTVTQ